MPSLQELLATLLRPPPHTSKLCGGIHHICRCGHNVASHWDDGRCSECECMELKPVDWNKGASSA